MSKKKSGGTLTQHQNRPGARLGIKIYGGQKIKTGQIILRQRGTKVKAGEGVGTGRDNSLYALKEGMVIFRNYQGKQLVIIK
jgi:large subunit ribosomal protein L27